MEELLIELVKHEPCIYDKRNRNFKDGVGVVKNVWDMIGKRMVEGGYPTMAGEQMNLFLNIHTDCIGAP